ncbi:cobyrinate a,c-diamide synthase [Actinomadura livida]|uniref:Hydrogenobyrinate a,c-diamide synthase n=1 Tax=Actinomadura livida TaxID=79909 RepID=A0A7W7IAT0_9ACTN|nr:MULTISPECIES: cobyrinate a,c-diamide synthase [Actinomadura]MBB4773664.1 cobyrinic acid a,c-diamide synthase [Actinomadura catellatispora]GGU09867.1 hydrogenobyrinate a,c-diamide synthase [Actinomadura livida]
MLTVPRLVVAAPSTGSGKTTVATGLMAAFAGRGLRVSPHKVGPDYIDPGYHALATGRPGRNLDPWLTSEDMVVPLFLHGASGADIAVVEGVMGLYDGAAGLGPSDAAGGGDYASTAHVATLLDAPVVLVVDASAAAGRSVAALVHGFRSFGTVRVGGVILNRLGSDGHERMCREAVEELGLPVLGALHETGGVTAPSRHLGLVPAAERRAEAVEAVRRLGDLVAASCDLDAVLALARAASPLGAEPWNPSEAVPEKTGGRPRVAVAGGPAFTFGYAENEELLTAAGAEVVRFDPLRDERLPEGTKGVVIGGGFPEVHAAELSANESLREEMAGFGRASRPVYAECAGLLYLAQELDGAPMCGVLDGVRAAMASRLTLGYRAAVAVADSVVARTGERVRGHEFHGTVTEPVRGDTAAWQWAGSGPAGFVQGDCVASYLHLHWAGSPWVASRFVDACGRERA